MTIPDKCRVFLLAILVGSLPMCYADAPSGQINFSFTSPSAAAFDFSGGYTFSQEIIGAGGQTIPLIFGISFTQDPNGFLHGSDTTIMSVGNDFVATQYSVTGKVSGGGHVPTRITLLVRLTGQDIIAGKNTAFSITINYNVSVKEDGTLGGSAHGSAHFSTLGGGRISTTVSTPLPAGVDGTWGLQMNIIPLPRLGGTALIVLSNGRTLTANLAGSYSPHTDFSTVQITGTGSGRGISLRLKFDSSGPDTLNGRLMGQTVLQ
jgi:hypothetical protein